MATIVEEISKAHQIQTKEMLGELGLPAHRFGYIHLSLMVPYFAQDYRRSITKDVYPYAATHFGYDDWRPIERSTRDLITDCWNERDPAIWEKYFPNLKTSPSNKRFIATLAARLK